jgi:uncharacterized repeat protein (TIGR01451 family)
MEVRTRWLEPRTDASDLYAYMRAVDQAGNDSGFVGLPWEEDLTMMVEDVRTFPIAPGSPLTFTLTFGNAGGTIATGAIITDVVPAQLVDVSFQSSRPITPTGPDYFTWLVGEVAPMQGGVITLTGTIHPALVPGDTFTNTATISATGATDNRNNASFVRLEMPYHTYLPVIGSKKWLRNLTPGDGAP